MPHSPSAFGVGISPWDQRMRAGPFVLQETRRGRAGVGRCTAHTLCLPRRGNRRSPAFLSVCLVGVPHSGQVSQRILFAFLLSVPISIPPSSPAHSATYCWLHSFASLPHYS